MARWSLVVLAVGWWGCTSGVISVPSETDASVESDPPGDSDTLDDSDTPADSDTPVDSDTPADSDSDTPVDSDTDAPVDSDTDVLDDSDMPADSDGDTLSDSDSDTPSDSDSDTPADSDTDVPDDTDSPVDSDSDTPDDADGDGFVAGVDCDDSDPAVHPAAVEVCGGGDEDCDGLEGDADPDVDPATQRLWWPDLDRDGFGDGVPVLACNTPTRHADNAEDCDDGRPDTHPSAVETCAPGDEDCDGLEGDADPDLDLSTRRLWYADHDGDGFGGPSTIARCAPPAGHGATSEDCDDSDAAVSPSGVEVCDPADRDEDCDGLADDNDASVTGLLPFFADGDGDGFGDAAAPLAACDPAPGRSADALDCDDRDAAVSPDADEVCDPVDADEDCDGRTDDLDDDAVGGVPFFVDGDVDGFGGPASALACDLGVGLGLTDDDCDDHVATTFPGAVEVCDGVDQDCDGLADDGLPRFYADADGDGYGTEVGDGTCLPGAGVTAVRGDCDDARADVSPDGIEVCMAGDEDCDGLEGDADPDRVGDPWYADLDGDGAGAGPVVAEVCTGPAGAAPTDDDCDDGDPEIGPDAAERYGDDVDDDCDGETELPPPPCEGVTVPGDYPTLAAAITAHNGLRDVDLCLGPGTHSAVVTSVVGPVTITGRGRDRTTLNLTVNGALTGVLTIRHVTHVGFVSASGGVGDGLVWEDATLRAEQERLQVYLSQGGEVTLRRTEVDLSLNAGEPGIMVACGAGSPGLITAENSWFHGDYYNVAIQARCPAPAAGFVTSRVTLRHNLFDHLRTAVDAQGGTTPQTVDATGNVFVQFYGTPFAGNGAAHVTTRRSVFEGVVNGYVTANLGSVSEQSAVYGPANLDWSYLPPRPTGAPLVDAGASVVTDFWGLPRVGVPDIGPVER